ncbi:hypothetical protein A2810_00515 [candidate division Kazan bacterium RIFCSPHIGHO2_01_FULL_49_10]|uniref:Uncharacterized protein n=1 Tax=candidate division Kazan bacterium RIFCSPLOWO2_01_FULL_48_13 TaxID=1798539 RepID=A0A1F4PN02_UNCK3|nr:MAG: hypothetical protein A2810_00515 [candidate division Kazan bacterium RIFCSPHIGHO2_01_FULL_49_10]OGB85061.1 MAG: hypothetical protein A2994_00395 [candidate division Kazan bacterium RIFCSPLOWO2_01_FULL_48_13]
MYDDDDKDQVLGGRRPGEASGPEGDTTDDAEEDDDLTGDELTPKKPASDDIDDEDLGDDLDDDLEKPVAKEDDDDLPVGFHAVDEE